ncbi:hypothetical protein EV426DRAFT_588544 [Tirmania nivea]|nr:hypothetical protein EV426DRAFT_588544 [Tirmania nivea]
MWLSFPMKHTKPVCMVLLNLQLELHFSRLDAGYLKLQYINWIHKGYSWRLWSKWRESAYMIRFDQSQARQDACNFL